MVRTAFLRAYEPLTRFSPEERERWESPRDEMEAGDPGTLRRWLISSALPGEGFVVAGEDGAILRRWRDVTMACPRRTRLRMLAGLLAFRDSVPEEVAEAFVPESEARRAAHELSLLGDLEPKLKSHILHANWHVPLRWFAAFDDTQRILTEDKDGLRVRYETPLGEAKPRLGRALEILESSWLDESVTEAIRELSSWLSDFADAGILELDYGSVAQTFEPDDLVDDRSAAEVWGSLEALAEGDSERAGQIFSELAGKWTEIRSVEVLN
jgi:hypothetical protein